VRSEAKVLRDRQGRVTKRMANVDHPNARLAGYIPDLPTPFDQNGKIDLASFERLCEREIDAGTTALVVGETTGESSTLTRPRRSTILLSAPRAKRRVAASKS
jgi:4-hydroxy-tetrahydrodipicolinate synthase